MAGDPLDANSLTTPVASAVGTTLTVVVPCYNERANVARLVERLRVALAATAWEVVFVDDNSPDGTAEEVRRLARHDARVRCIERIGRRGLASAVIEGALSSSADYIAVIDGDLQHDEKRLPDLLAQVRSGAADIAVASRYVTTGRAIGLANAWRRLLSEGGIRFLRAVLPVHLTDPLSGFFVLRRDLFEALAPCLTGQGFKILLDLLLSAPAPLRVVEVEAEFFSRSQGESKLDVLVLLQFLGLVIDKLCRGMVPLRFISFAFVGAIGVLVNVAVLTAGRAAGLRFVPAQVIGTVVAMIANFQLNNVITYRDMRLRGAEMWRGLALFILVCSVGAFANVGIARLVYQSHMAWTLAGALGAAIGVVWNYAVSSTVVWTPRRARVDKLRKLGLAHRSPAWALWSGSPASTRQNASRVRHGKSGASFLMTATRRADPLGTIVLLAVVAFLVIVLAAWFRLDTQPPRWDESLLLTLSEYSYQQLARGNLLGALHIESVTNAKTGMLPFLSAVSYFVVGDDERLAAFIENAASLVLLGLAMRSLSLRLFGDALPAAAGLALIMSSMAFAIFSHGYYVEMPLVALVALTIAAAVEIRAREFAPSMWSWVLGLALLIGIPMKHLYLPFVAMPLLFTALHYLLSGAGTMPERRHRLLRVGAIALVATLVGLSYHILNWRVVAEQLLRAGDPARTGGIGRPADLIILLRSLGEDVFRGYVIAGVVVLLVGTGALLVQARYALALLMVWILNVTVVVAIAASFPLGYYFLPFYPAFGLLAAGWLARPMMPQALRLLSAGVLLVAVGVGIAAASFVHLGTYNPLAVVVKTPSLLLSKGPSPNPFVSYDSMAPKLVEAHHDTRPYAHDWRMDEFVAEIGKVVAQGPADRIYSVALMSGMERMSHSLITFKLWQHRLQHRVGAALKFGQTSFEDVDFLIFKTGEIFSYQAEAPNPALAGYQAQVEKVLADNGAALERQGFSLVLKVPLPDGTTGTLWAKARPPAK